MPIRPLNMHRYECDACEVVENGSFPEDINGIILTLNEKNWHHDKPYYAEVYACSAGCLTEAIDKVRKRFVNEARAQNQMG